MTQQKGEFVFLVDCGDLGEAQVLKSFLQSHGLHPRVRDLHTRTMASHLSSALGKLTVEVPMDEFIYASKLIEDRQSPVSVVPPVDESHLTWTQGLAKKSLLNAVLGLVIFPILPNFYSVVLGYRVLKSEKPISKLSLSRLFWAIVFNSIAFILWFVFLPTFLQDIIKGRIFNFF